MFFLVSLIYKMSVNVNSIEKFLKSKYLVYVVGICVISYLIYRYNERSTNYLDTMNNDSMLTDKVSSLPTGTPAGHTNNSEEFMRVDGGKDTAQGLSSSYSAEGALKAEQLLPKDNNTQFSQLNPQGKGPLGGISLLSAGHHLGIDTKGSTMRNSNLQVRSEPTIPQIVVSPWGNTTIEPNVTRPTLEIGNSATCM
jgi:hypothetical protein